MEKKKGRGNETDIEPKKIAARQLDFTVTAAAMCRPSNGNNVTVTDSPPMSPPVQLQLQLSTPSPSLKMHRIPHPVVTLQDSPKQQPVSSTEGTDGTPTKKKQCNCKNSRCLKLYCECFAAGVYCDGCNCSNCQNNVEKESVRQRAVAAVLDRNPNAFRGKITKSQLSLDTKEDTGEVPSIAKHKKGCHCKKSGCLKKYCECFQANILCSDNCKCVDCKNFEESEDRRAVLQLHGNSPMAHVQNAANAAINGAIGSSGYGNGTNFLTPRKRKGDGLSFSVAAQQQQFANYLQENHARPSASSLLTISNSPTSNLATAGPPKSTYKSPLADIIQPQHVKKLCSILVVVSDEVTKNKKTVAEKYFSKNGNDSQNSISDDGLTSNLTDSDKGNDLGSDGVDVKSKRPLSPGTRALMCDEENTILRADATTGVSDHCKNTTQTQEMSNGHESSDTYAEQEKAVLTRFRDFLTRLVTYGTIRETLSSSMALETAVQQKPSDNENIFQKNESRNGIVISPSPAGSTQISKNPPVMIGIPIRKQVINPLPENHFGKK
ncbi:hypothetical protein ACFE04_016930 [Oxalis oulophora]